MKKTLSLVLALVMVALMIPVAAFATSAEEVPFDYTWDFTTLTPDNGLSGNITNSLPTGWIANDDPDVAYGYRSWPTTINYDYYGNNHSIEDNLYVDVVTPIGVRVGGAVEGHLVAG